MADESSAAADSPPPQPPPSSPTLLIPDLPDDVALQCIARVPRSRHPSISLVSKSWQSTLQPTLPLLNVRVNSSFTWYLLDPNPASPNKLRTLSPLPPISSQPIASAYAVLGSKIYVIGGAINEIPSNCMWVFDCRFNKWEMGPRMRVGREFAATGTVNGKIYVMGGCQVDNWARSVNWAEVFDPVSGSWTAVPSPVEARDKWMHASAVIHEKIYAMADRGGVVYDASGGKWGVVLKWLDMGWRGRAAVVDGEDVWKELKGVGKGLPKVLCGATMANVGGRLLEMEIICAGIEVQKDQNGDLSGSILWHDVILVVPTRSSIVHCVAVGF
ncbi:hypothetical protein NMG60_11007214 [Bertholletia excelsa]